MPSFAQARRSESPSALMVASAALLSAAMMLVSPSARADDATSQTIRLLAQPIQLAEDSSNTQQAATPSDMSAQPAAPAGHPSNVAKAATSMKPGSVEERIDQLHTRLKITPEEEQAWNAVAQAMRDNAAAMEKLVADKRDTAPQDRTAVDDLKTYQEFAEAHVDGLKNLTSAFETLYDAMPDQQKKTADRVFQTFGRQKSARSHQG